MIQITNLAKVFNKNVAVNIPSLKIKIGEVVGLVGNNGAGKTTTFRLMLDLLPAETGNVMQTSTENILDIYNYFEK